MRFFASSSVLFCTLLLAAPLCWAGSIEDPNAHVQAGRAEEAEASPSAESEKSYQQGLAQYNGKAGTKNYSEAAKHFRAAAELGHPMAQFSLAVLLEKGTGVKQDVAEALKWYRKAADQGNSAAQFNLGLKYSRGEGVPQDQATAAKWFNLAAAKGHAKAQLVLGRMYNAGLGVEKDPALAEKLIRDAAAQGLEQAKLELAKLESVKTDRTMNPKTDAGLESGGLITPGQDVRDSAGTAATTRQPTVQEAQAPTPESTGSEDPEGKSRFVNSVETAVAAMPVDGVMPSVMLPPIDLSNVSSEHWAGIVSQVKEGMALIYGEISDDQKKEMDGYWDRYFEFPAPAVLEYFSKLQPLVAEFAVLKEAFGKTSVSCDQAQFHLAAALAEEDFEASISHAYSFKRSSRIMASQSARMKQLAEAVGALGELPDPQALKKQARKFHDDSMAAAAIPPENIEGTWTGEQLGSWTIQILHRLPKEVLLVDTGDGGRGVMQPFNESNSWLFIQGADLTPPEECTYWRLDILNSRLRVRSYEPSDSPNWYDVGTFKTFICEKTKALTERESYRPETDTDSRGEPLNWAKIFDDRYLARMPLIEVLRTGELPQGMETSRRREWAAANSAGQINDAIERMAAESGKDSDLVDRGMAQGRAFEREMAEQYYYYGQHPPGFDNCADYDQMTLWVSGKQAGLSPDREARLRRQNMLLWNLQMRLELRIKQEQDYVIGLHKMKPDQRSSDLVSLTGSIKACEEAKEALDQNYKQRVAGYRTAEASAIAQHMQRQADAVDDLEKSKILQIKSLNDDISRLQSRIAAASDKDKEALRGEVERTRRAIAKIPSEYEGYRQSLEERTTQTIAEEKRNYAALIDGLQPAHEEAVRQADKNVQWLKDRKSEIASTTVRRLNASNEFETVPLSVVLAEAKMKVEEEFDFIGYVRGLIQRLDEELPETKGMSSASEMSLTGIAGDCQMELPSNLSSVRCISSSSDHTVMQAKPAGPPQPTPEELAQQKQQELEAQAKKDKIAAFQEEIVALQKSIEGVAKTEAEIAAGDKDRVKKLEGLARDRMALEGNIKAAQDQIRFVETGVYHRTRTSWDDYNRQMMMEDSRVTANYWEGINRKLDRMDRLIEAAPSGERDALRHKWNSDVESAIREGCKFDKLELAARDIGQTIQGFHLKDAAAANAEANLADRNMRIAQGVKTVCDYSLTALTIYATAGLASPVSMIMPTCAETAISTGYCMTTGYIEGGPEEAFKQAAITYSMAAGLVNNAMESYQSGVLNHLEEYSRNPQKVKLDETSAGLSSMGWALTGQAAKLAAMTFVVSPSLVAVKNSLRPPKDAPKSGGGIFGPEEIRFKPVNEMRQERLFRDKDLYGKHLMQQFKKAQEDVQNARGAGKADFEIKDLLGRAEAAYKAANSDFHAKNWMKRAANLDEKIATVWCEFDAANKGRVIDTTLSILSQKGLSNPDLRCFSNSASKGSVGMDMDLGFVEPPRWIEVPHWKNPKEKMLVANPEYVQWRNSLTITDPKTGATKVISPREYAAHAQEAMNEAYRKVYGHPPDEAFLEFTYSDHPEAYKDKAWLGKEGGPGWADFCNINPAYNGQTADVSGFKVNRMQKPGSSGGHDELPSLPRYSIMLEQSRGLVKDLNTKLFGAKADTAAFGGESGNLIKVNPNSPLGQMPKSVQAHFTELRTVLNDFAGGRLTPSQAERKLYVLTGGQGIVEVPQQMKIVLDNYSPAK
jgi:hypothetical protein